MRLFLGWLGGSGLGTFCARLAAAAGGNRRAEHIMQTAGKTNSFLTGARAKAVALHKSIEQATAEGGVRMNAALEDASDKARDLAETLKSNANTVDATAKAKLNAAVAHAEAIVKQAQSGRPRPMLDEARKLAHDISDAVAHVRTHGATAGQK